jgi:hypothetical protein
MLHLAYWQLFILLHRPFYRRTRPSTGSENDVDHVALCDTAAQKIMELIDTWKSLYTLRYVPITFIQVVFSAGTIFLLSAIQATSRSRPIEDLLSQAEQCSRYLHDTGRSWHCANRVATILSSLLQEQLKPKLLRHASQNRRSQSPSKSRRGSDQAASSISLHDPYEGLSPVSPLPDQSPSDWSPTELMGGGRQIGRGDHIVVDTTSMHDVSERRTRMDSDLAPSIGLGMQSGETLPSQMFMTFAGGPGPEPSDPSYMWNTHEAEITHNDFLRLQQFLEQNQYHGESMSSIAFRLLDNNEGLSRS